jgi:hypothetical protein
MGCRHFPELPPQVLPVIVSGRDHELRVEPLKISSPGPDFLHRFNIIDIYLEFSLIGFHFAGDSYKVTSCKRVRASSQGLLPDPAPDGAAPVAQD